jgi:hypothetical protein
MEEFTAAWYSKHLRAMREPPLACAARGEVYRFTWLRTFHHPVSVRIDVGEGQESARITAVELDGAGGYGPGKEHRRTVITLNRTGVRRLLDRLQAANFWSLDSHEESRGFDGAEWILEGSNEKGYRLVTRWSPDDGEVRDLGLYFLRLTDWSFPKRDTY